MDIPRSRLTNQRIAAPEPGGPADVVRWMGATQAQDAAQAAWAVGLRSAGATVGDVERAIADREIVRTWPMRGTLHLVPAGDARWMVGLSEARMIASTRRRREQLGLDDATMTRCLRLFASALPGGGPMPRSRMLRLLADAGVDPGGQRGYHVLWYAAQVGLICQGPRAGAEDTFALLDEWVPGGETLSREVALATLAGRYVASHGPATVHDFAWWAGLTVGDARLGLDGAQGMLTSVPSGGKSYWVAGGPPVPELGRAGLPEVYLLPGFDEYLLGYRDRDAVLNPAHARRVVPGANGVFFPTVIVDGQVAGTWKRRFTGGAVEITVSPFGNLDALGDLIDGAARSFGAFLGLPLAGSGVTIVE